jgi:hypothetical protein
MYFAAKKIFLQCISFGSATSLSECESVCEFMNVELKQTAVQQFILWKHQ